MTVTHVEWLKDQQALKVVGKELSSDSYSIAVIMWGEWRGIDSV